MNKKLVSLASVGVVALLIGCSMTACDMSESQIKVIAQNAGLYSAVGWIALDDPTQDEIATVRSVLALIEENAASVQGGATYTEVIFPILVKYIDTDVDAQYRPICKAGAISLLGGIDMLFAANPEWQKDQDLAIDIVEAFILGAKNGLGMKEDHPVMKQARLTAAKRARVYKK